MFYTYLHLRESDSQPFYIGKGKGRRAWAHVGRNVHWKNVVAKHGLKVEICAEWKCEKEAFEHEKFLISCFKDIGFKLVNLTDGGEGASGYKQTPEAIAKTVAAHKGAKRSSEVKKNISLSKIGKPGPKKSDETKAKISEANKGKKLNANQITGLKKPKSEDHKKKLSIANIGKTATLETKKKQSEAHSALWLSESHRQKMVKALTGIKKPNFAKAMSNKKWINNGIVSNMINKDLPVPDGFILGRLKKVKNGKKEPLSNAS